MLAIEIPKDIEGRICQLARETLEAVMDLAFYRLEECWP